MEHDGDVTEMEFVQLFQTRLGDKLPRALTILHSLGERHAFSVANVIHLSIQKGNTEEVLGALELWCGIVKDTPDPVTAHVDTRQFFDITYTQLFRSPGKVYTLTPKLWTPES